MGDLQLDKLKGREREGREARGREREEEGTARGKDGRETTTTGHH